MKIIARPRMGGKTHELLAICRETGATLVCHTAEHAAHAHSCARTSAWVLHTASFSDFRAGRIPPGTKVVIDDLDLADWAVNGERGVEVLAASVTVEDGPSWRDKDKVDAPQAPDVPEVVCRAVDAHNGRAKDPEDGSTCTFWRIPRLEAGRRWLTPGELLPYSYRQHFLPERSTILRAGSAHSGKPYTQACLDMGLLVEVSSAEVNTAQPDLPLVEEAARRLAAQRDSARKAADHVLPAFVAHVRAEVLKAADAGKAKVRVVAGRTALGVDVHQDTRRAVVLTLAALPEFQGLSPQVVDDQGLQGVLLRIPEGDQGVGLYDPYEGLPACPPEVQAVVDAARSQGYVVDPLPNLPEGHVWLVPGRVFPAGSQCLQLDRLGWGWKAMGPHRVGNPVDGGVYHPTVYCAPAGGRP